MSSYYICDRLRENLAYGIHALFAQCTFSGRKYQSPIFVIFMSKSLSTNLCCCLQRLTVSYKDEISLHFDLPSLYSCRIRRLLLWAPNRILYLDSSNCCTFAHLFSFLGIEEQSAVVNEPCSIFTFISNSSAQVHLIDLRLKRSLQKCHTRA